VIARRRFIVNFLSVREYFFREDGSHGSWFIQQIQKSPTYISFGRKEKHNDQKDSCIYGDGIAPSGLRTDTQRRQRAKLHRQLYGVRDRDEVWPHGQHQMQQPNLLPGSDRRWRLRSAATSGTATLNSFNSSPLTGGTFQVIGKTIVVAFGVGSGTGENNTVVLVAPANASTGTIGVGIYDSGANEATGLATFGVKNSCFI
jgi:hypothetical protein